MTNSAKTQGLSYRDAGVDIDAGDALVDRIKPLAKKTLRDGVVAGIGGFGALFEVPKHYKEPILVSGTDGVGTKLKLAFEWNAHETIGQDLVAMSVNDIWFRARSRYFSWTILLAVSYRSIQQPLSLLELLKDVKSQAVL